MATTLDKVVSEIQRIKSDVRREGFRERPRWPMIVSHAQGLDVPEGNRRQAHQGLLALAPSADGEMHENTAHVRILEQWMKSYRPAGFFDDNGRLLPELSDLPLEVPDA